MQHGWRFNSVFLHFYTCFGWYVSNVYIISLKKRNEKQYKIVTNSSLSRIYLKKKFRDGGIFGIREFFSKHSVEISYVVFWLNVINGENGRKGRETRRRVSERARERMN